MINKLLETHKEIQLTSVTQGNSTFYSGVVDINDFSSISTISAAEYIMNKIEIEEYEKGDILYQTLSAGKSKGYQRQRESAEKINKIASYIKESNTQTERHLFEDFNEFQKQELYHVIPNAILLAVKACELNNGDNTSCLLKNNSLEDIIFDTESNKLFISKELLKNSKTEPHNENYKKFFIIDGYHRLLGFQKYLENDPSSSFQFVASFLINRELEEEAEIFTTVNKTATKVDTSYYYHVVGEFEIGQREHIYLHNIARYYNEVDKSIFKNKIKMLGKKDPAVAIQPLSQAFFIEQIYNCLMKDKGYINVQKFSSQKFPKRVPILRYYLVNQETSKIARTILLNYFNAIDKEVTAFNLVPEGERYFFLKTLPFGALILIFPVIYFMVLNNKMRLVQDSDLETVMNMSEIFSVESFTSAIKNLFESVTLNGANVPWLYYEYKTNFTKASSQGLLNQFAEVVYERLSTTKDFSIQSIQEKYYSFYNIKVGGKPIVVKV